jgi:uncharacterized protein (DUF362 family)
MNRREFVGRTLGGLSAGSLLGWSGLAIARSQDPAPVRYDLVAVKGGEPEAMFDRAIAAMGGMGAFVAAGSRVLVKPNIGWDAGPERAANTHPGLVRRIIEHCYKVGAKDVAVFDHTCDTWTKCYSTSGIERAARDAGATMIPGNTDRYFSEVELTGTERLTRVRVHEAYLASDVIINVPILKDHSSARLTIGMKNLMGVVWDRGFWHRNDLHRCIAEFATYRKPHLTVVDAYRVLKANGPRGVSENDAVLTKSLLVSTDPVAADAAAAKLYGLDPADIEYITLASEMKIGTMDLGSLSIHRITI